MNEPSRPGRVVVTGGAGYVGSVLVPELLDAGWRVTVLDRFVFGEGPLAAVRDRAGLTLARGDIRDPNTVRSALRGATGVIHLAAISNGPSSDLDPDVTRSINADGTRLVMAEAKRARVRRFLYASSASVYGVKEAPDVTEDLPLEPITLCARCEADGEDLLNRLVTNDFVGVSVRSATVCGDSPRLRLDLTINLLTDQALRLRRIRVLGGAYTRPTVHIKDLTRFYRILLEADADTINARAFNVCRSNVTSRALAEMIRDEVDPSLQIQTVAADDPSCHHLSGRRALDLLGFAPEREVLTAVRELKVRYERPLDPDAGDDWYRNVRWMTRHPERWR